MTLIPNADYRPDVSDLNGSFTSEIENVLCADGLYIPAQAFQPLTSALPAAPLGQISVRTMDGTVYFFAGTAGKLYVLNNSTLAFTDVSKTATTYAATSDAPWCFVAFGNYVIAVNENDDPQVYQIGVDTKFRDLAGSPPRGGIVKIWGDFVVMMKLTSNPNRVQWSGLNDAEYWTPGSNNSDYQDFPDGGRVTGSSDVTNPIILLESAIQRATFVPGSAEIFPFQKVQEMRGAKSPLSVATRGSFVFFADEGGFFQVAADGSVNPIGFEKVDRTVFNKISVYGKSKIMGAIDPFYSRVYWAVDTNDDNVYEEIYVYDWQLQRWTTISVNVVSIWVNRRHGAGCCHFRAAPEKGAKNRDAFDQSADTCPSHGKSIIARLWGLLLWRGLDGSSTHTLDLRRDSGGGSRITGLIRIDERSGELFKRSH